MSDTTTTEDQAAKDRADYEQAQARREAQSNRVNGLGY